jgi:hypothetical protein
MDDEERQAEITRLTQVIEAGHDQEADRRTAEIMERLDLQKLNAGINKTVNPTSLEAAVNMVNSMKQDQGKMLEQYSTKWSDTMATTKPNYNITFQNTVDGKQVEIGKIDFNGGALKFEGNFEESAVKFMDHLAGSFNGRLKAEHVGAAKLLAEFVTFELGEEMELDDGYRKGFNDAIHAVRGILSKKIKEMENKP